MVAVGEGFGEVTRFGVEGGEDTEVGGVGGGVGRAFGCDAGFGLAGKVVIDSEGTADSGDVGDEVGGVGGLETTDFGFFA